MIRIRYFLIFQKKLIFQSFYKKFSTINIIPHALSEIQRNKIEGLYEEKLRIPSLLKKIESNPYFIINPSSINVNKFNFLLSNQTLSSLSTYELANYYIFLSLYPQYIEQMKMLENLLIKKLNLIDFETCLQIALTICSQLKNKEQGNNQLWNQLLTKIKNCLTERNFYKSLDMYKKCYLTLIFSFSNQLQLLLNKDYEIIYMQEYKFEFLDKIISELAKNMKIAREEFCLNNKLGILDFGIKLKNSKTFLEFYKLNNDKEENDRRVTWLRKVKVNYVENFLEGNVINIFLSCEGENDSVKNERKEIAVILNECVQSLLKK